MPKDKTKSYAAMVAKCTPKGQIVNPFTLKCLDPKSADAHAIMRQAESGRMDLWTELRKDGYSAFAAGEIASDFVEGAKRFLHHHEAAASPKAPLATKAPKGKRPAVSTITT